MTDPLDDVKALVDIHRQPWSTTGWGDYPAAHTARRIAEAIERGELWAETSDDD